MDFLYFQRIVIKPHEISPGVSNLTIHNCPTVQIRSGAIKNTASLRSVNIHNINRLELQDKSFEWAGDGSIPMVTNSFVDFPKLSIQITNSHIPNMNRYTFNGNIRDIIIDKCSIDQIHHFAFSNLNGNEKIHFKHCEINHIHVQGFKKFTTNMFLIENTTVHSDIISRTLSDIEVRGLFRISDHCNFKEIKPSAFIINNPLKVEVIESNFDVLDGEAFKIHVLGDASIRDNKFRVINPGAFVGITATRHPKLDFVFANNFITEISDHSLDFNDQGFNVKIYTLNFNTTCSCEKILLWSVMFEDLQTINCLNDDRKYLGKFISVDEYKFKHCNPTARTFKVFIIILIVLIMIIIVGVTIYLFIKSRYESSHQKEWINNASPILARRKGMQNKQKGSLKVVNGKLPMVVPDGRTYRETVVVVEQADLLTTEL